MTQKIKMSLALDQIDSILHLIVGNEYEKYMTQHLLLTKSELIRQLSLLTSEDKCTKIKE
jgi:hypothetical protein